MVLPFLHTFLPARKPRSGFSQLLWETQRVSMSIVRLGGHEILFIAIYGFANRYREGKRPNDLLLASLIPAITEIGLPFCILGDFNGPPTKLPSYQFFRELGTREAFEWYAQKNRHYVACNMCWFNKKCHGNFSPMVTAVHSAYGSFTGRRF